MGKEFRPDIGGPSKLGQRTSGIYRIHAKANLNPSDKTPVGICTANLHSSIYCTSQGKAKWRGIKMGVTVNRIDAFITLYLNPVFGEKNKTR